MVKDFLLINTIQYITTNHTFVGHEQDIKEFLKPNIQPIGSTDRSTVAPEDFTPVKRIRAHRPLIWKN
jgi:hypothetical protein